MYTQLKEKLHKITERVLNFCIFFMYIGLFFFQSLGLILVLLKGLGVIGADWWIVGIPFLLTGVSFFGVCIAYWIDLPFEKEKKETNL